MYLKCGNGIALPFIFIYTADEPVNLLAHTQMLPVTPVHPAHERYIAILITNCQKNPDVATTELSGSPPQLVVR